MTAMNPNEIRCANCRKPIHMQRNGDWYHDQTASVSCYLGQGSPKRAEPRADEDTCTTPSGHR